MTNLFKRFFKKEKEEENMRAVAYGELCIGWTSAPNSIFSVIFYEDDNKKLYRVSGRDAPMFDKTTEYAECETWLHTGLLPEWAKDPIAEKLSR